MFSILRKAVGLCIALAFVAACNTSEPKHKNLAVKDEMQLTDVQMPAPPPPSSSPASAEANRIGTINQEGVKDEGIVASPTIVKDEEVMPDEAPPQEQNKAKEPKFNTEDYDHIIENPFQTVAQNPLSTFSIDVDEAAYSNVRRYITDGHLPPRGAVRIEEMINYFDYDYPQPADGNPFAVITEASACPWSKNHQLVHIGLQGKKVETGQLPPANLVFLIDVSGSMDEYNKLPLVQQSLNMLAEQLRPQDKVAIVTYAGNAGLVLPSTSGSNKQAIKEALNNLQAGGSTAGGEGIQLAYKTAKDNFLKEGNNRIVLCTDGDFNVGISSDDELVNLVEKERKGGVFLSVLGFGMGNYKDNKMQQLADKGNGNHSYIDNANEAKKVLVNEFSSTLFTIAKDVKLQIEFNPARVQSYRLIGYENRMLAAEDFNDDAKDAGELGSGHTVTALYEVIPVGVKDSFSRSVDPLKYGKPPVVHPTNSDELMTIKLRYKAPDGEVSKLITKSIVAGGGLFNLTSNNFRFAAAVAEFGLLLRQSVFKQAATFEQVVSLANGSQGIDREGYRAEFVLMVKKAKGLTAAD